MSSKMLLEVEIGLVPFPGPRPSAQWYFTPWIFLQAAGNPVFFASEDEKLLLFLLCHQFSRCCYSESSSVTWIVGNWGAVETCERE